MKTLNISGKTKKTIIGNKIEFIELVEMEDNKSVITICMGKSVHYMNFDTKEEGHYEFEKLLKLIEEFK